MPDTLNIFDSATMATILKWAIMILVTGFIAQFGKQFATFIIGKIRNIRARKAGDVHGAGAAAPAAGIDAGERARLKLEKKLAKSAAKERKKGS